MPVSQLVQKKYPDSILLTTAQISDATGISTTTIRRAVREGKLPAFEAGKIILVEPHAVDEWITPLGEAA